MTDFLPFETEQLTKDVPEEGAFILRKVKQSGNTSVCGWIVDGSGVIETDRAFDPAVDEFLIVNINNIL